MTNPMLQTRMGCASAAMDLRNQCQELSGVLAESLKKAAENPSASGFESDGLRKLKDAEIRATQAFRELRALVDILADQQ